MPTRKPTELVRLPELLSADYEMQGHIVYTTGIGRGFQYSPQHPMDTEENKQTYHAYLQVRDSNYVVKVQGNHNLYDCSKVASMFKTSSETNLPLEVIAHINGIKPIFMQILALRFGPYLEGDREHFDRFKEVEK